jgi:outer membrane protein assembly factor BamB
MLSITFAANLMAGDWPCFTGPNHDSIAPATGLASSWPKEGPKVIWEAKIAGGVVKGAGCFASPVVSQGKVFVVGRLYERVPVAPPPEKAGDAVIADAAKPKAPPPPPADELKSSPDILYCLDAKDGKEQWKQEFALHADYKDKTTWNTPVIDGDFVYARGGDGEQRCINIADGKTVWTWPKEATGVEKLLKDRKPIQGYGISAPSVIVDDILIVPVYGGFKAKLVGLDKKTGELKWDGAEYGCWQFSAGCMIPIALDGRKIVLINNIAIDPKTGQNIMAKRKDPKTGKEIPGFWDAGSIQWDSAHQGNKLITGFMRDRRVPKEQEAEEEKKYGKGWKTEEGIVCLEFSMNKDGAVEAKSLWEWSEIGTADNSRKSPGGTVMIGEYAYVFFGRNPLRQACFSIADGKMAWSVNSKDKTLKHAVGYGNSIAADGKIFFHQNGQLTMMKADPKEYNELASVKVSAENWSTPAMAGTELFIRDDAGVVKCLELSN